MLQCITSIRSSKKFRECNTSEAKWRFQR